MKKFILILLLLLTANLNAGSPLLIYYGNSASSTFLNNFQTVILEPENYDYLFGLNSFKYGYISIGEVEETREYFDLIKNKGLLSGENPNWKGSYFVSLKSGEWQDFVIKYLIPSVLSKGYDGLFLDTIDSLVENGESNDLIINFVNSIKSNYPKTKLMLNRGFTLASKLNIDAILLESTITSYDFNSKSYFFVDKKGASYLDEIISSIKGKNIKIYSLDYWDPNDIKSIKKIYKTALKRGYIPYVSEISLQTLPKIFYQKDSGNFIFYNNIK